MARKGENVLIRFKQGGAILEIESGALIDVLSGGRLDIVGTDGVRVKSSGEISIETGGTIDVESGGKVKVAGTDGIEVATSGEITIETGGTIDIESGGKMKLAGAGGIDVNSSGEISVKSGGSIDLLAGALFEIAGTDIRAELAAAITIPVAGVAAGYMLARGVVTPTDGADTIVTGLTTVVAAIAMLVATPILTHMWSCATIGNQSGAPAAGSIIVVHRSPAGSGDVTPQDAASTFVDVAWIAIGT